jgi:hypothetical protein
VGSPHVLGERGDDARVPDVAAAGGVVVDTSPGTGKAQAGWIDEHLASSSLKLDAGARKLIEYGKGQSDAKVAAQLQAGGYVMIGQSAEKAGDYGKALILAEMEAKV